MFQIELMNGDGLPMQVLAVVSEMTDVAPDFVNRALLIGSHPVLDYGEGLLDRVEVGRVWRQVPEPCASGLGHLPDGGGLVGAKIIHK